MGIHYLPKNETLYAKIIPSESSTRVPLCKRDDNPTMTRCASMDTLIAGNEIKGGTKLYSSKGFSIEFQTTKTFVPQIQMTESTGTR
jgi:hypothetical protein